MGDYPATPEGWTPVGRRSVGPFTTHVSYRLPDGGRWTWSSRLHRKHASRLSRGRERHDGVWWAPRNASWWIGVLFAISSTCFLLGPMPGLRRGRRLGGGRRRLLRGVDLLHERSGAPVVVFEPRRIDWWSSVVQLVGTLYFNVDTFRAMSTGIEDVAYDRLVWAPDAFGSACFLISGYLAYLEVCGAPACRPVRTLEWWIAAINLTGCVAFGVSAVASYVVPATGSVVDIARANAFTALGGLCFLAGAVMLLPEAAGGRPSRAASGATAPAAA